MKHQVLPEMCLLIQKHAIISIFLPYPFSFPFASQVSTTTWSLLSLSQNIYLKMLGVFLPLPLFTFLNVSICPSTELLMPQSICLLSLFPHLTLRVTEGHGYLWLIHVKKYAFAKRDQSGKNSWLEANQYKQHLWVDNLGAEMHL